MSSSTEPNKTKETMVIQPLHTDLPYKNIMFDIADQLASFLYGKHLNNCLGRAQTVSKRAKKFEVCVYIPKKPISSGKKKSGKPKMKKNSKRNGGPKYIPVVIPYFDRTAEQKADTSRRRIYSMIAHAKRSGVEIRTINRK